MQHLAAFWVAPGYETREDAAGWVVICDPAGSGSTYRLQRILRGTAVENRVPLDVGRTRYGGV